MATAEDFDLVGNDDDTYGGIKMDKNGVISQSVLLPFGPLWGFPIVAVVEFISFRVCPHAVHDEVTIVGHSDRSRPK